LTLSLPDIALLVASLSWTTAAIETVKAFAFYDVPPRIEAPQ